ncbi:MAG: hypothetical protein MPK06_03075 [Alphaproteobacteria bacterium]|nr:hypothetical protein [Alphaproteobacteria bacterium]MDA8003510.1 hypothetical protein [Alphaproteobacteria bacterium]MDA8005507.1 hypothetical protein [Alphaproteobacteria bacterium]MDA8013771.1 hypothetical protein [Alphaproteobacteria bacterium]
MTRHSRLLFAGAVFVVLATTAPAYADEHHTINELSQIILSTDESDAAKAKAYNLRGQAHAADDRLLAALADFTEAIRLNNNYADAYINRSRIYSALKDYGRSYLDLRRARLLLGAY